MIDDYVQYGCGLCAPETWTNFDSSPTLRFERVPLLGRLVNKNVKRFPSNVRYGDILRGLPIPKDSCSGIYCSHVLEHFALEDCNLALQHTFQHLKPGGIFRLVLPDLEQLARGYLNDPDPLAAFGFMNTIGRRQRPHGLLGFIKEWLGNSAHLWLWDAKAMTKQLADVGFKDIRRADFGDSEDKNFQGVEDKRRFDYCLAMQCRK